MPNNFSANTFKSKLADRDREIKSLKETIKELRNIIKEYKKKAR